MPDEEKAEEYIIAKYKLNECYIEDTEETRVYMSNNVHSEYQQEYECYLAGLKEGRKEPLSKIERLEKENAEAKKLLKTFLLIADNKVSQMEFQLCVADAKQFLNSVVENIS